MKKKIRFTTQLVFFIFTIVMFFGVVSSPNLYGFFSSLHVFTNLSSLAWLVVPTFWGVTVGLILLSLIFGRIYCSFICPVGFIQDVVNLLSRKKKKEKSKVAPNSHLRLLVFGLCLCLLITGSSLFGYIDHLSSLGRLLNLWRFESVLTTLLGVIFLGLVVVLPVFKSRWFCHVLCPTGAFYSLLSKVSLFRTLSNDDCNNCRACEPVCPANCINVGEVERTQCIDCFECIDACPANAFKLQMIHPFKKVFWTSPFIKGRRHFLSNSIFLSISSVVGYKYGSFLEKSGIKKSNTVIPPGSNSTQHFFSKCTSCGTCISVCPTNVLKASNLENGPLGVGKPMMDYDNSNCGYECNACLSVCPTQALTHFPLKRKKQIKIGTSVIDEGTCIPYADFEECGACVEHCPTGGVVSKLINNVLSPVTIKEFCIGCGVCQKVCPVNPIRAIIVKPEDTHSLSYHPNAMDDGKIKESTTTDFPF